MIKPIETYYNGYKFRSRLEARWAVFFDSLGVKYEYEPEGFKLPSGKYYLPDFRIKCYGKRGFNSSYKPFYLYVEVKGHMTQEDADKICEFVFDGSDEVQNSLLLVGDIPNPETYEAQSYDIKSYDEMDGVSGMYPWNYYLIDGDCFAAYPAVDENGHFYLDGDDSNYTTADLDVIRQAFRNARQSRFEHGEKPNIIHPSDNKKTTWLREFKEQYDGSRAIIVHSDLKEGVQIQFYKYGLLSDKIIIPHEYSHFIIFSLTEIDNIPVVYLHNKTYDFKGELYYLSTDECTDEIEYIKKIIESISQKGFCIKYGRAHLAVMALLNSCYQLYKQLEEMMELFPNIHPDYNKKRLYNLRKAYLDLLDMVNECKKEENALREATTSWGCRRMPPPLDGGLNDAARKILFHDGIK